MASKLGKSVLGIDISKPLIELSWDRSKMLNTVEFAHGDAAEMSLDKKRDVVISRFGVMFFSDFYDGDGPIVQDHERARLG